MTLPLPVTEPPTPPRSGSAKIVFVVTEDWFFASHFLPMARAAGEMGLQTVVVTRVRDHRAVIEASGARVIPLEAERRSLNPLAAGYAAGRLAAILKAEKPAIVHCIALRAILVGGAAAVMAGVKRRVYALTGLGFLGARGDLVGRAARQALRLLIRGPLESRQTHFLFENRDDPRLLGLDPDDTSRVTIVGGAGIDPALLHPAPLVPQPPLKVAIVARMLWSKGIDLGVEAVRRARAEGAAVELSLYGAPDPSNPEGDPRGDAARLEPRGRRRLARTDARSGRDLARAPRLLPALARRRGAAAHASRRRRLRARACHDRRARLPRAGARRDRGPGRGAR